MNRDQKGVPMSEIMIIECFECQSKVSTNILFEKKYDQEEYFQQEMSSRLDNTDDYIDNSYELDSGELSSLPIEDDFKDNFLFKVPYILYLLECPICYNPILALSNSKLGPSGTEFIGYEPPRIVWPKFQYLDSSIPSIVRKSIEEAQKCYMAQAYSACAVMCGRAMEALCKDQKTKDWQLSKGLKELKDRGIIDGRLYEWGESLKNRRNAEAHATDVDFSKEDAIDLLSFSKAICEYVYVLSQRYEDFKKREAKLHK